MNTQQTQLQALFNTENFKSKILKASTTTMSIFEQGKTFEDAIADELRNTDWVTNVSDLSASRSNLCGEDILVETIDGNFLLSVKSFKQTSKSLTMYSSNTFKMNLDELMDKVQTIKNTKVNNFQNTEGYVVFVQFSNISYNINVISFNDFASIFEEQMTVGMKIIFELPTKALPQSGTTHSMQMNMSTIIGLVDNQHLQNLATKLFSKPLDIVSK